MALFGFQKLETSPLVHDLLTGKTRELLPMWSDRFDELRELGLQNVIEVLELGIRQGRFRKEIDVERVARTLQDMQLAAYLFRRRDNLAAGLDLVLNGLLTRTA